MQLFKCSSRTFWDYYINSLWPFVDIVSLYSRSTLVIFSAHIILHTPWMYSRLLSHSRSHSHTDQHTYGYSHTRVSIFIASSLDTLYRWRHRYTNHTCISRIQRSLILNTSMNVLSFTNRSYLTEEQHSYSMWNFSTPDQPLTDGFPAEFCKHLGSLLSFVFSRVALKLYFQSSSNNENIALNSSWRNNNLIKRGSKSQFVFVDHIWADCDIMKNDTCTVSLCCGFPSWDLT